MKKIHKVIYLGYSERMLKYLSEIDEFKLIGVFSNYMRVSGEFITFCNEKFIEVVNIATKDELLINEGVLGAADVIIMYKFEFIISKELIARHRIINFHGGNLRTNRGAHAVVWSILHEEKNTCLSMYQLTGGIDEGILIDEYSVDILNTDDPDTLNKKLQDGIPTLLNSLVKYLNGEITGNLIEGGIYHAKIQKKDFVIDFCEDSFETISAKIRSQKPYFGAIAIVNGRERRIKEFDIEKYDNTGGRRNICYRREYVIIEDSEGKMILKLL